jgi:hypothetical protein
MISDSIKLDYLRYLNQLEAGFLVDSLSDIFHGVFGNDSVTRFCLSCYDDFTEKPVLSADGFHIVHEIVEMEQKGGYGYSAELHVKFFCLTFIDQFSIDVTHVKSDVLREMKLKLNRLFNEEYLEFMG